MGRGGGGEGGSTGVFSVQQWLVAWLNRGVFLCLYEN